MSLFQLGVAFEYNIEFRFVKAASQGATDDTIDFRAGIKPTSNQT